MRERSLKMTAMPAYAPAAGSCGRWRSRSFWRRRPDARSEGIPRRATNRAVS